MRERNVVYSSASNVGMGSQRFQLVALDEDVCCSRDIVWSEDMREFDDFEEMAEERGRVIAEWLKKIPVRGLFVDVEVRVNG